MLPFAKFFFQKNFIFALFLNSLFLLGLFASARGAGELDPSFNAGAFTQPAGIVTTVVVQPDGKVLVGGNFEVVNGVLRNSVARLNPDGSLDTTFNPPVLATGAGSGANPAIVEAIVVQPDGRIIIAGNFTIPGFNIKGPIVRLNADGSLDPSFNFAVQGNSVTTGVIKDVEIRADGKIVIAGGFSYTSFPAGIPRSNLARLNSDGTTDETFATPNFSPQIDDVTLQADGKVIGFVTPNGGGSERFLRRLNEDGSLDPAFNALVNDVVLSVKIQPDGKILIGGRFTNVNNFPRHKVARLDANGVLDETFNSPIPSAQNANVNDIEFGSDGKILIGGVNIAFNGIQSAFLLRLNDNGTIDPSLNFNRVIPTNGSYNTITDLAPLPNGQIMIVGEMFRRFPNVGAAINRINANGSHDASFTALLGNRGTVVDIAPLPNGQIVIGGSFGAVNRAVRPNLARLNADGSTDTTFTPTITGANQDPLILAVTALPDNRVLVGGQFFGMLVRLNLDGSTDTTFNTNLATSGPVYDIAVQPDGKIIGVGQLTPASGSIRHVMRFNPDGSIDSSFQSPVLSSGSIVRKVVVQPDGKILIGGSFSNISGQVRNGIARLNANGTLDTSFNPLGGANGAVLDIALQADGKLLISGQFSLVNGINRPFIARLNPDATTDTTFDAAANGNVLAVEVQADGKILVGGSFTAIGGVARNRIGRLNPNGSIDLTFNVGTGTDGNVNTIELDASGRVLAGGVFVRYNNTPRVSIVRLLNTTAPPAVRFDYNGDGRSDISVFRPSAGAWYIARPTGVPSQNFDTVQFGINGDIIVPADYDGDGKTDVAVWRPSDGTWYIMQSSAGFRAAQFGASGDIPVPGDFDGDGKANLAVFRPSTGSWYIARATGVPSQNFDTVPFGASGDKPIVGADFDGDGKADVAVFRPTDGNWYRINSSTNQFVGIHFGIAEDKPVAADYDGDGKTDLAVWRPSDGVWYRINSGADTFTATQFGISSDRPSPADYDGDGKADLAVFRPSEGIWYLLQSTAGFTGVQFGSSSDIPTPNAFVY